MRNLSKSKIIAFRQCPKRLWLELHKPELRDDTTSEMVFQIGHQVGKIAQRIYDPERTGIVIDIQAIGHKEAIAHSAVLLAEGKSKIFEAGFVVDGTLVYADVMLPDYSNGTLRWKMIEVKSSTSMKNYHRDDIAVQAYIASAAGINLSSVSIAHVNSTFVYLGDDDYQGLLTEIDLTKEALSRTEEVKEWITGAQSVAALAEEPPVATGSHCHTPFACAFCRYCNRDTIQPEYPLSSLPRLQAKKKAKMMAAGYEDLRDVPDELLGVIQARIKKCSITGEAYFDAIGAALDLSPYGSPAYFLDFETAMFPVPVWKGTRPYQQIPFQFSLHVLTENRELHHHSFLDLSGNDPSHGCAKALQDLCSSEGPIFTYNAKFEKGVIADLATQFPEFAAGLKALIARIVDLLPIAQNRYYHPSQHGSWSIKAVLPAICPDLSYESLDGVKDGGMAVSSFIEAIAQQTTLDRKEQIRHQLHEYCKLDTFAMVRMWEFFNGISTASDL